MLAVLLVEGLVQPMVQPVQAGVWLTKFLILKGQGGFRETDTDPHVPAVDLLAGDIPDEVVLLEGQGDVFPRPPVPVADFDLEPVVEDPDEVVLRDVHLRRDETSTHSDRNSSIGLFCPLNSLLAAIIDSGGSNRPRFCSLRQPSRAQFRTPDNSSAITRRAIGWASSSDH